MCGICGILSFNQQTPDQAELEAMSEAMAYRGPDDNGVFIESCVGLGHRRLSIIDLSQNAHQPMVDKPLGLTIVFNGTIYNYPALREQLINAGYSFKSSGDTEVILKAFHHWGEACVERLQGMFAFAIWQSDKKELFLARDRFGIKPLYFSQSNNQLRFASNTRALLLDKSLDTRIDPVSLHHQFTLHAVIPAPNTLLKGIRKLPPATCMTITGQGETRSRVYWQLDATRPDEKITDNEWYEEIRTLLLKAVEKRLKISDVPVGVLLSGGLDSSLIVALLAEAGAEDLSTFSIGFDDVGGESGNEFEYSDQVVDRYQTKHHRIIIPNSDVLARLPEAVDHMAEPMVGQDAVAFYLLAERVSAEVKVVQSGQGADEVFGGYFWYPRMHQSTGSPLERFAPHYFDRDHEEYLETVTLPYWGEDHTSLLVEQRLNEAKADSFMDQVFRFDVTTLVVDDPVKRVDNMTMAWGLEARVPFLDQSLVEASARMPVSLKLADGGKSILKKIARGILPDGVIDRPKGYFPVPALKFVQGDFLEFMKSVLISDSCRQRNLFQVDYIERLLASPETEHTRLLGSKLWHLALLEFWLQRHVDAR